MKKLKLYGFALEPLSFPVKTPILKDSNDNHYAEYYEHESFELLLEKLTDPENIEECEKVIEEWKEKYGIFPGIQTKEIPKAFLKSKESIYSGMHTVHEIKEYEGNPKKASSTDLTFINLGLILPDNKCYVGGRKYLASILDKHFDINIENAVLAAEINNTIDNYDKVLDICDTYSKKGINSSQLEEQRRCAYNLLVLRREISKQRRNEKISRESA